MNQGAEPEIPRRLREVAKLLGHGKTNQDIAEALAVTLHTVEKYVSELKQALDAKDRVQLAFMCQELGSRLP